MHHVFSADEVDALIPTLEALVARQLGWAREINVLLQEVKAKTGHEVSSMDQLAPVLDEALDLESAKRHARDAILRYEDGWTDVQDLGAVVKDPRAGVLEFWGLHEGRYVWLTWGYGDKRISYFHELDTAQRKPMNRSFRESAAQNLAKQLN